MKKHFSTSRRRVHGFTLLEILVASTILTIVLGGVALSLQQTVASVAMTSLEGGMDAKASDLIELMSKELKDSGTKDPFLIGGAGDSVTFRRSQGASNGAPVWGNQIRYYTFPDTSGNLCLARDEVVGGSTQTTTLCNHLSPTPLAVTAIRGVNDPYGYMVNVTGVNFTQTSAGIITITLILQKSNALLKQNTYEGVLTTPSVADSSSYANANDNIMVTVAQGAVHLLNNL
jgi:prepilin-type N-terminal cleavage/methylation domain-containing protein